MPLRAEVTKVNIQEPCSKGKAVANIVVELILPKTGVLYDVGLGIWQDVFADLGKCHQNWAERVRVVDEAATKPYGLLKNSQHFDIDGDGCGDLIGPGKYTFRLRRAALRCVGDTIRPIKFCPYYNSNPNTFCFKHVKVSAENCWALKGLLLSYRVFVSGRDRNHP
jgi:hypothetical protein